MRDVTIPEDVVILNLATREPLSVDGEVKPWSMYKFLTALVLPDPGLGKGYRADKLRCELDALFADRKPGDVVGVEDAPWEKLKEVIENPQHSAPSTITMACLPFQEAIVEAQKRAKE